MDDQQNQRQDGQKVRCEIGAVIYDTNVLGLKGPRKMTALIPAMTKSGEAYEFRPTQVHFLHLFYFFICVYSNDFIQQEHDTILERYKNNDDREMLVLKNKAPQWNEGIPHHQIFLHKSYETNWTYWM